jgi:hypothetical protein
VFAWRVMLVAEVFPNIGAWIERVEALPGYDRTFPPHWR